MDLPQLWKTNNPFSTAAWTAHRTRRPQAPHASPSVQGVQNYVRTSPFCRDWGVQPRACRPYRARTNGKTESGVKYVKRNALAGLTFDSFTALEQHLAAGMILL